MCVCMVTCAKVILITPSVPCILVKALCCVDSLHASGDGPLACVVIWTTSRSHVGDRYRVLMGLAQLLAPGGPMLTTAARAAF